MKKGTLLIVTGSVIILSALALAGHNFYTADAAYRDAEAVLGQLQDIIPEKEQPMPSFGENEAGDDNITFETEQIPDIEEGKDSTEETKAPVYEAIPELEMPVRVVDDQEYIGILEISDISVKLPVISRMSYPKLKKAPCRYSGSAYTDDLVIGAHCYEKFFARLKNVSSGAQIKFTDMDGNVFIYRAVSKETIDEKNDDELKSGEWALSLFTCPVMTNTDKRIVLRCERIYQ